MLDRNEALKTIHEAYAARVRGDKEALGRYWADGARFEIVGDRSVVDTFCEEDAPPMQAISQLIDHYAFSGLELVDAVVEGDKVAARWKVTVEVPGKPPVSTQLLDLITFDEAGKIASFTQFADTAMMLRLAG